MGKRDSDDYIISETGNWNVADQFSKHKIMRSLILCDYYEDVARFGYDSLDEELLSYSLPSNDVVRIKAIDRLCHELLRLIDNTKFALKKSGTKEKALEYRERITKIKKILPKTYSQKRNNVERSLQVGITNPVLFEDLLNLLSSIKSKINEPLNQNHLIFVDKEEFDPVAFKDRIKHRIVHKG